MDNESRIFFWNLNIDEIWGITSALNLRFFSQDGSKSIPDPSTRIFAVIKEKQLAKSLRDTIIEGLEEENVNLNSLDELTNEKLSNIDEMLKDIINYKTFHCVKKNEIDNIPFFQLIQATQCEPEDEPELYNLCANKIMKNIENK